MKGILRGTVQHSLAWSFTAVYGTLFVIAVVLTAGKFPNAITRPMTQFWGRVMLVFSGVKVEFEGDCEALLERGPRVFTFNHASTLDLFIVSMIASPGGVSVVKREIIYIPFLGWAAYFGNYVLLDRRNRQRAIVSLENAGRRIREESLSVFIAPEGTRTSSRIPSKFKMGAFRMAEISGASIVPVVIDGGAEVWPKAKLYCPGGTVKVRLLEPITHAELLERGTHAMAEELRERYAADLGVELPEAVEVVQELVPQLA